MSAVFAAFDFNAERFAQLLVNVLAVGGGFLVGFLLSGFLAWLLDRQLTGGKSPQGLKRTIRMVGGVAVAVLVALIVFGHGHGWNLFGGAAPGEGEGKTDQKGDGPGTGPPAKNEVKPDTPPNVPPPEPGTPIDRMRVTVLAGSEVKDARYYLIDDDRTPHTLSELEAAIRKRKESAHKPVGVVPIYPASSGDDTPGAAQLFRLARQEGIPIIPPEAKK